MVRRMTEDSAAAGEAADLRALIADIVTVVSHDLRQPLMVVQGYLSLIEDGALGPVPAEIVEIIPTLLAKVDEANAIIEQTVTLARLEAGTLHSTPQPADLRSVVAAALRRVEPLPETHSIAVEQPDRSVPVVVDSGQIELALGNLLGNAVRFSPRGGEVRVTVSGADGRACVDVADSGIGIAASDLPILFARLGRVRNQQTRGISGCGLGLVTARGLARRFGGDVMVSSSEPGRGSVFSLLLPLGDQPG